MEHDGKDAKLIKRKEPDMKCHAQGISIKSTFCVLLSRGIFDISLVDLAESIEMSSRKKTTSSDVVSIVTKCFPNIWQLYYRKYDLWVKLVNEKEFKSLDVRMKHTHSVKSNLSIPVSPEYKSQTIVLLTELDAIDQKQAAAVRK
jgi:hypothetical protein